ncbi:MAG TPA: hypothetical protein VF168_01495 [Trueperaceae bacterium]
MMRVLTMVVLALVIAFPTLAQNRAQDSRSAQVTLERHDDDRGVLEIELLPEGSWRRDVFVSLYRGEFRERKGIRPQTDGSYRSQVTIPEGGEWGVYLRYGVAQAGYAGYGRLAVPPPGESSSTIVRLASGFAGEVPPYVQPLGFAVFGAIALATLFGLRALLQRVRRSQQSGDALSGD